MEALYRNPDAEKMAFEACREHMRAKLAKKPEIFEALVPDFAVGCRRLTPEPGVCSWLLSVIYSAVLD